MSDHTVTLRLTGDGRNLTTATNKAAQDLRQLGAAGRQGGEQAAAGMRKAEGAAGSLGRAIGAISLVMIVREIVRMADASTLLDARLRVVARSQYEYAASGGLVLKIAQETRAPLEATASLYSRMTQALKDTGASQAEVVRLTTTINKAFQVSGATTAEAAAATTQLAQGLAAGALRGDEFNSVAEQAPRIMDALAKSLGVSRGELRKMAENGEITADVMREALAEAAQEIDADFAKMPITIGQSLTQVENAAMSLLGWFDQQTGASGGIAGWISKAATTIENLPVLLFGIIGKFKEWWAIIQDGFTRMGAWINAGWTNDIAKIKGAVADWLLSWANMLEALPIDKLSSMGSGVREVAESMKLGAKGAEDWATTSARLDAELKAKILTIQESTEAAQAEFTAERALAAATEEGTKRTNRNTDATKENTKAAREAEKAKRALEAIDRKQLRAMLQLEAVWAREIKATNDYAATVAQLDQELDDHVRLSGLTGEALAREEDALRAAEIAQRIYTAAKKADVELSPEQLAAIEASAAARMAEARALSEAAQANEQAAQETQAIWTNCYDGIARAVGDFVSGGLKSFKDFANAAKDIVKRLLSDLVTQFMRTQLRLNMSASGTGGGGMANMGGMGGAGAMGMLGSVLGPAALLYAGASTGNPGQGALYGAGAGLMFASGAFGAGLIGGTAVAGGISAATGAALGSVVPIIGTIIGAVIGAAAAYFMREDPPAIDTIGPGLVGTSGYRNLAPGSVYESDLGGFAFASIDNVDREARDQLAGYIQEFDAAVASFLKPEEVARVKEALAEWNLHLEEGAITAENILGSRWEAILSAFPEDIQEVVRAAGDLEDQVKKLGEVLRFPEAIREILDQYKEADTVAGLSEYDRQLRAINKEFDEAREVLVAMSASEADLAELETYRTNAINRLTTAQDAALENERELADLLGDLMFEDSIAALSEYEKQQARINRRYDDMRDRAILLGATQEELAAIERTRARELAGLSDAMQDFGRAVALVGGGLWEGLTGDDNLPANMEPWRQGLRGIQTWLNGEQFAGTSTMTPEQRVAEAQRQYQAALQRAMTGRDAGSLADLQQAAQRLLEEGRGYYSSGSQYDALRDAVRGGLEPLGLMADQPGLGLPQVTANLAAALNRFVDMMNRMNGIPPVGTVPGAGGGWAGGDSAMVAELRAVTAEVKELRKAVSASGDKQVSAIRESQKRAG